MEYRQPYYYISCEHGVGYAGFQFDALTQPEYPREGVTAAAGSRVSGSRASGSRG